MPRLSVIVVVSCMRCCWTRLPAIAALAVSLASVAPAAAQSGESYPAFGSGDAVRVGIRVKLQGDWRDFEEDPAAGRNWSFDLHRTRIGLEGTFLKRFDYEIERELRDDTQPWRDVYLNVRLARVLQLRAGDFKIPFSQEQLTGSAKLDFVYRSLAATYLAPGRDRGLMAHGAIGRALKYQVGVFRRGGEAARDAEVSDPQSARTVAARLVLRPWNERDRAPALRGFTAGAAYTHGHVPEGLNSVRGRTVPGGPLFHDVMVNGARRRVGVELAWVHGPLSFGSELIRVADERRGQGLEDDDLPRATARGWYVSGVWRLADRLPGGLGAVELAGRVEHVAFGGGTGPDLGTTNPRAVHILGQADRVVTAGINWSLTTWTRVQANLIHEQRRQGDVPAGARSRWSPVVRLQFTL